MVAVIGFFSRVRGLVCLVERGVCVSLGGKRVRGWRVFDRLTAKKI